jgi:hypothetical protein
MVAAGACGEPFWQQPQLARPFKFCVGGQMRKQLGVLLVAVATSVAGLSAQGSTNKPNSIIIIGCLQGGGKAFTLKDNRSGRSYQIDGDAESLAWHVGHELEIHGSLGEGARVKAEQVVYVATKCAPETTDKR